MTSDTGCRMSNSRPSPVSLITREQLVEFGAVLQSDELYGGVSESSIWIVERHITRVEKISFTCHYGKVWQIP